MSLANKLKTPSDVIIEKTAGEFLFSQHSKHVIYGILNLVNGKIYIGSAVDADHRLRTHKSKLNLGIHPSKHLQGAWNEYGSFSFEFLILEHVLWKSDLLEREDYWIELTNCYDPLCGYNKRKVAKSNLGLKLGPASDARRKRISEVHKGRIVSEEQREASRKALTGRKLSPEHIANSLKGRKSFARSEEMKAKNKAAHKAKSSWPHEKGEKCNCRECLDRKNLARRLRRYNHEGEFSYEV